MQKNQNKENLRFQAELEQRNWVANQRYEDMKRIGGMMKDTKEMVENINTELHAQAPALQTIKEDIERGNEEVKKATAELDQMLEKQQE